MSKLIVNNLSCQRGYKLLFENLSFELNSGEVLKVSGPNGSGKTSLMKILAGLSSFETGSIDYDDTKINSDLKLAILKKAALYEKTGLKKKNKNYKLITPGSAERSKAK